MSEWVDGMDEHMNVFLDVQANNKDEVTKAGIAVLQYIYHAVHQLFPWVKLDTICSHCLT